MATRIRLFGKAWTVFGRAPGLVVFLGSTLGNMNKPLKAFGSTSLVMMALILTFIGSQASHALDTPSISIRSGTLMSPAAADDVYATAPDPCPAATCHVVTEVPKEIVELAKGLGANRINDTEYAQAVFQYVYANIELTPLFGMQKGAFGALIDQHGTAFDQADLMVQLLVQDTTIASTVSYQYGTITISEAQAANWLGISYMSGTSELYNNTALQQMLADGGIPATISGGNVTLSHIWVQAAGQIWDPSFKTYKVYEGIDLADAMGCGTDASPTCGSSAEASAMTNATQSTLSGGTVPYIQNVNEGAVTSTLNGYAQNLVGDLKANHPNAELHEVIGGREIDLDAIPAAGYLTATRSSPSSWSSVPDVYRTTLGIQFDNVDKVFYMDEVYGKRFRLFGRTVGPDTSASTTRQIGLYLDFHHVQSSSRSSATMANDILTTIVDHPYAASNGSYMDATRQHETRTQASVLEVTKTVSTYKNSHFLITPQTIIAGFGDAGAGYLAHTARQQRINQFAWDVTSNSEIGYTNGCLSGSGSGTTYIRTGDETTANYAAKLGCFDLSTSTTVVNYLVQLKKMQDIVGQVGHTRIQNHHQVGIADRGSINVVGSLSAVHEQVDVDDREAVVFANALASSRLEASVVEQLFDVWEGESGVSWMVRSNDKGHRFLLADNNNINAVIGLTTDYSTEAETLIRDAVTPAEGFKVIVPEDGAIGTFTLPNGEMNIYWSSVYAYKSDGSDIGLILGSGFKGGGGVADPMGDILNTLGLVDPEEKEQKRYGVDLGSGTLTLTPAPDLVAGGGAFPESLPFQRIYSSGPVSMTTRTVNVQLETENIHDTWYEFEPSFLGAGWTHNYDLSATQSNDAMQVFGQDSALDASSVIVGLYALVDANRGTQTQARHLASVFVGDWWGNRFRDNAVTVQEGAGNSTFIRLADGSFNPPPGSADVLTTSGSRQGPYANEPITLYDYKNISVTLKKKNGQVLSFDGVYASNLVYVPSGKLRVIQWKFPSGITLDFEYVDIGANPAFNYMHQYQLSKVSNNLGRALNFTHDNQAYFPESNGNYLTDENGRRVDYEGVSLLTFNPIATNYEQWPRPDFKVIYPDQTEKIYGYKAQPYEAADMFDDTHNIDELYLPKDQTNPFLTFQYDDLRRVTKVTDAVSNDTDYFVGSLGGENLKAGETVDALGNATVTHFDSDNRTVQIDDPLGRVTSLEYDGVGRLVARILPELNEVRYAYDSKHNVKEKRWKAKPGSQLPDKVVEANYVDQQYTYSGGPAVTLNLLNWAEDAKGNRYNFTHKTNGLVEKVKQPCLDGTTTCADAARAITTYSDYNLFGQLKKQTGPEGTVIEYNYGIVSNHSVLLSQTVDPTGKNITTSYNYDVYGNETSVVDPLNNITSTVYDALRRPTRTTDALSNYGETFYDDNGWPYRSESRDAQSNLLNVTESEYTDTGKLRKSYGPGCFDAAGTRNIQLSDCSITTNDYDPLDRPLVVTDGEGRKAKTIYDGAGQVVRIISAWQGNTDDCTDGTSLQQCTQTNDYSDNGQRSSVLDANGNKTTFTYDGFDRADEIFFPESDVGLQGQSSSTDYEKIVAYDANGNVLTKLTRARDHIVSKYDALNRIIEKDPQKLSSGAGTPTEAPSIFYTYDLTGREKKACEGTVAGGCDVGGLYLEYAYDTAGRVTGVNREDGRNISYLLDKAGNRTKLTWPDAFHVTYGYDALNRLTAVTENGGGATPVLLATYAYDDLSRRDVLTFEASGGSGNKRAADYGYAVNSNLIGLDHKQGAALTFGYDFGYNKVGQMTSKAVSDPNLQWRPDSGKNASYDPNGLNQYGTVGGQTYGYDDNGNLISDGANTYTYDTENRLVGSTTTYPQANTVTYTYGPTGPRRKMTVNGTVTKYLSDGVEEIAEYNSAGTVLRRYVHGAGVDERLVYYPTSGTGGKQAYLTDRSGTVIAMADSAGALADEYRYSPYGEVIAGEMTGNPFRYTGRRLDFESGLYYYRARYYDPRIGRFLQTDPIGYGDGMNMYAYAGNDPTNYTDPTGLAGFFITRPLEIPGAMGRRHAFNITTNQGKDGQHSLRRRFTTGPKDGALVNSTGSGSSEDRTDAGYADRVINALNSGGDLPEGVTVTRIPAPDAVTEAVGDALIGNPDYDLQPERQNDGGANSNSGSTAQAQRSAQIAGNKFTPPTTAEAHLPGAASAGNVNFDEEKLEKKIKECKKNGTC